MTVRFVGRARSLSIYGCTRYIVYIPCGVSLQRIYDDGISFSNIIGPRLCIKKNTEKERIKPYTMKIQQ
jgi:hypothetical protein